MWARCASHMLLLYQRLGTTGLAVAIVFGSIARVMHGKFTGQRCCLWMGWRWGGKGGGVYGDKSAGLEWKLMS